MAFPATDLARFRPDDPDPLVHAAFACPCCLRTPTHVRLCGAEDGATAHCRCTSCPHVWSVELDVTQVMRVQLRPPWAAMHTSVHLA